MRLGILLAAHLFFLDAVGMAMCIVLTQQPGKRQMSEMAADPSGEFTRKTVDNHQL